MSVASGQYTRIGEAYRPGEGTNRLTAMVEQGRMVRCNRCGAEGKVWGPGPRFCGRCGLMVGLGGQPPQRPSKQSDVQVLAVIAVCLLVVILFAAFRSALEG
ncbi:hypothetical protein GCM10023335_81780 [Streptomyces siamensis]|uniref:Zinc ribbon domain-containing protein n=1 Tax=Streptomyces siamensis TaxID=1274986 RepID=A0ABP9JLF7_9ACTN